MADGAVQRTIFEAPLLGSVLGVVARVLLKLAGWRVEGSLPPQARKSVLIAAPHTSNWDFPYTLLAAFALRLNIRWMGKASLFAAPFGPLMRWLGGIAVRREQSNELVAATVAALCVADGPLQLVVAPEGTRRMTRRWRTGFYYIALGAELPILMTYLDYGGRRCGLGPALLPSGDIERDMATIKAFYAPMRGRNPRQFDAD